MRRRRDRGQYLHAAAQTRRNHLLAQRHVQLLNFLGIVTVEARLKSLGNRDVLIAPDLGDISAGSFEQVAAAIKIGEDAARAKSNQRK